MRKFTTLFFLAFFGMVSCAKANTMKSQPLHLPSSSGGCLITPEIISEHWDWFDQTVSTREFEPSIDNHYILTTTWVFLSAKDPVSNRNFEISSALNVYTKSINWRDEVTFGQEGEDVTPLHPDFKAIGKDMDSSCIKEKKDRKYK